VLTDEEVDRAAYEIFHLYDELFSEVFVRVTAV
jgi:hypothetical protein